jgi:hypothetical protein
MGLRENDTLEFPGAATLIEPPITGADCTNFPSFEELALNEQVAPAACTIRNGMAWALRTVALIETDCEAV